MKIKEVCERTHLTRRAVRFYEEKGLVSPAITAENDYRDYGEADVRRLLLVARLREYRFSVEQIRRLLDCPQDAEAVFAAHRASLSEEHDACGAILAALERLRLPSVLDPDGLLDALTRAASEPLPPPRDLEPDFGRFDDLTREERAALAHRAKEHVSRMETGRRKRRAVMAAVLAAFLVLFSAAGIRVYWENQPVTCTGIFGGDVVFSGVGWSEEAGAVLARFESDLPAEDGRTHRGTLCLPLPNTEAGDVLQKAILPGEQYAGFSYAIRMPRRDAQSLGLLAADGSLSIPAALDRMLTDESFALRYACLTAVHSGSSQ